MPSIVDALKQKYGTSAKGGNIAEVISSMSTTNTLVVGITSDGTGGMTLDKTWQEIYDALAAGMIVTCPDEHDGKITFGRVSQCWSLNDNYTVTILLDQDNGGVDKSTFNATSSDGYPEFVA